ncbi:MAG: heat-inducible transcriptional repressor HrcA [Eubacteriales bacterium]|nr:heat-inducible transcriptional repressor HrcA [Eubacteriales bacterium]
MKKINELTERQRIILNTIIKTYLDTGEPVGSRTISKLPNFDCSSATIRNEMQDLEELGYLIAPHTSAGRIPSDKGYRFYVDNLIKEKDLEINNVKKALFERVDHLEIMLKGIVKTIASNTNYAALVTGPTLSNNKIKYIQISKIEEHKLLAVIVCEANIIKSILIDIDKEIDIKKIVDIQVILNNLLSGMKPMDLLSFNFNKKLNEIQFDRELITTIVTKISDIFNIPNNKDEIYTYGANNFFKYPEFQNIEAQNILEEFETKEGLQKIIENVSLDDNDNNTGIQVYIGEETSVPSMKDCSIVTAKCDFGNGLKGTIGVVGPKRMDYEKVMKTLKALMKNANDMFKEE